MTRHPRGLVLLAAVLGFASVATETATALDVVVEDGAADTGTVTLQPAVVVTEAGSPATFVLVNGGSVAIDAEARLTGVDGPDGSDDARDVRPIHLASGERARIEVPAGSVEGGIGRLVVTVADPGAVTIDPVPLVAWVVDNPAPASVRIDRYGDGVVVASDRSAVVSIQARRRSWLGSVSSQVTSSPVLLMPDHVVELGRAPWLPGPSWVDVLVVDHAGTETRATFRTLSATRDTAILVAALLLVVAVAVVTRTIRRSRRQPLPD